MTPIEQYTPISDSTEESGVHELQQGTVGCVILAGGVGSRLGFEKPKGTFVISAVKHKSLFELLIDRTRAAAASFGKKPAIAIMTSEATHQETVEFFKAHKFFGLESHDIDFFEQESLPQLDDKEHPVQTDRGTLTAPDGNGKMFWNLKKSEILSRWQKKGIKYVSTVVIDNPLADPFDARLIGFHQQKKNDVTCVGITRENPEEKLGVFGNREGHLTVVEYSEIAENEKRARTNSGALIHPIGNISFFVFSLSFIEKLAQKPCTLPVHRSKKRISARQQKDLGMHEPITLWKYEYFIFDILPYAKHTSILVIPRAECFSPLKNTEGPDSPALVQQALIERDRKKFHKITGTHISQESVVELSPEFLYPTTALKEKWIGRPLPKEHYIDAGIT